jgi:hypothetical protein
MKLRKGNSKVLLALVLGVSISAAWASQAVAQSNPQPDRPVHSHKKPQGKSPKPKHDYGSRSHSSQAATNEMAWQESRFGTPGKTPFHYRGMNASASDSATMKAKTKKWSDRK